MHKLPGRIAASLFIILFSVLCSNAAELSLIEKRLIEFDRLNKQAIHQAAITPHNSSIDLDEPATTLPQQIESREDSVPEVDASISKQTVSLIEEQSPYTVQVSSSRSRTQCFQAAQKLRNAGYPAFTAFLEFRNNTIWHRIFVGSYSDKGKAETIKATMNKEKLPSGIVRSMPFSVQVGSDGTVESLEPLRKQLEDMQLLPFSSSPQDGAGNGTGIRLLIGAFETREDTYAIVAELRAKGFPVQVVSR